MKLETVKNLEDLLIQLRNHDAPVFVNLCSRCGNDNFLMDQVVSNAQVQYGEQLGYQKLSGVASAIIKEELKITKNPVLLLIKDGEIQAVFGGVVAQYKLEQALQNLKQNII